MEPTRSTDPFCSSFTTTLSWNLPGLPWPCSLGRLAALATLFVPLEAQNGQKGSPKGLSAVPTITAATKGRHLPRRCFKFTKATSNSSSFSFSSSSVSKVLSEPPDSLEDAGIASPKSEIPFGKVTPPVFTVSSPWTSEKDHSTNPWSLRTESRTSGLVVWWINHWATGTLSKCRPQQK